MKNRIFISTRTDFINSVYGNASCEQYNQIKALFNIPLSATGTNIFTDQIKILYFSNSKITNQVKETWLIVIQDNLTVNEFKFEITDSDYLLHHSAVDSELVKKFNRINIERKMHSANAENLYKPIFDTLIDENNTEQDKIEKVFELISGKKKLEAIEGLKIEFLYHIYNGGAPRSFSRFSEIPQIQSYENLFDVFNQDDKLYKKDLDFDEDETKGKDQRKKLSLLRDTLLANN